jgi:hypothetical protein
MSYVMPSMFTVAALTAAFYAAKDAATPDAQKGGGWVRLATCDSMSGGEPYAVAVRGLKDGRIQIGCACKNWIFRCQKTGQLCKHQQAVLCGGLTPCTETGTVKINWYTSGETFLATLAAKVMEEKVTRHMPKKKVA